MNQSTWNRFFTSVITSLVFTLVALLIAWVLRAFLLYFGIAEPIEQPVVVSSFLILDLVVLFFLFRATTLDFAPREIDRKTTPRNLYYRFLSTSPLRMAIISNVGLTLVVALAFAEVPTLFFSALFFLIFLNIAREFFTVDYSSHEITDKLINQILITFRSYCEQAMKIDIGDSAEFNVRTNFMISDEHGETIGVLRSCGMLTAPDRNIRFSTTKGIAGKAFRNNTLMSASATDPKAWGFEDDELSNLEPSLQWVWSSPIRNEQGKPIGVLNVDIDITPNQDETKVAIATYCQDFASSLSLVYQLHPKS